MENYAEFWKEIRCVQNKCPKHFSSWCLPVNCLLIGWLECQLSTSFSFPNPRHEREAEPIETRLLQDKGRKTIWRMNHGRTTTRFFRYQRIWSRCFQGYGVKISRWALHGSVFSPCQIVHVSYSELRSAVASWAYMWKTGRVFSSWALKYLNTACYTFVTNLAETESLTSVRC